MQNKHVNNLKAENLINMEKEKFPFTTKNISNFKNSKNLDNQNNLSLKTN